jgi:inner membrane transporter RhtA
VVLDRVSRDGILREHPLGRPRERAGRSPPVTVLLGLLAAFCWGVPDVPLAVAVRRVGELSVLIGSLAIGLVLVTPVVLATGAPHLTGRGLLLAAAAAAITVAAYLTAFTAFQTCPVSVVTPILSCEGAVAAVIAVAGGERLSAWLAVLLVIAVAGVVLVGAGAGDGSRAHLRGVAFVSLAALCWGGVLAMGSPVSRELGVWWGLLLVRALALLFAVAVAICARKARAIVPAVRAEPWRIAAWGIGDTTAYLCFYLAVSRGPVAVADVLAAQFATFGTLAGVVLLGERLRPRQWLGVAIVVLAVSGISALG